MEARRTSPGRGSNTLWVPFASLICLTWTRRANRTDRQTRLSTRQASRVRTREFATDAKLCQPGQEINPPRAKRLATRLPRLPFVPSANTISLGPTQPPFRLEPSFQRRLNNPAEQVGGGPRLSARHSRPASAAREWLGGCCCESSRANNTWLDVEPSFLSRSFWKSPTYQELRARSATLPRP